MNRPTQRVAVLGGSGFIGLNLCRQLAARGVEVLSLSRSRSTVIKEVLQGPLDLLDVQALTETLGNFSPSVVYFLAGKPDAAESLPHAVGCVETNTLGVINMLEASRKAGVELVVYGDSSKVYGSHDEPLSVETPENPISSYAIAKLAGWKFCQQYSYLGGPAVVSLRPTMVYGPGQAFNLIQMVANCVKNNTPIQLQGGSQTRDPLYIDDAVEAFISVADHPECWGKAIPIGGGQERSVASICRETLSAMGSDLPIITSAQPARPTEIWRSYCDNRDALDLFGWNPRWTLRQGLVATLPTTEELTESVKAVGLS